MDKRVILITGVSSGIGKAFVRKALSSSGDEVVVVGIGRNNSRELKDKRYIFIKTDLSNFSSIKHSFGKLRENIGKVDVLINNAGFAYRGTIEDLSPDEIMEQFDVNLIGPMYLTSLVLPLMRKQRSGHIINISSVASVVSTPTLGYYAATKASMDKVSEVLEQEVKKFNIKVSILIPGAVKTNFGKHIKIPRNYPRTHYKTLYEEWIKRFEYFFHIKNSPEDIANSLWGLIKKPQRTKYINIRDYIMCSAKKYLPYRIFHFFFLNYFYNYEG